MKLRNCVFVILLLCSTIATAETDTERDYSRALRQGDDIRAIIIEHRMDAEFKAAREQEESIRVNNEAQREVQAQANAAEADFERRSQEEFARECAEYYARLDRERAAAEQAAWDQHRAELLFKCPKKRPPAFYSPTQEFNYWRSLADDDTYAAMKLGDCYLFACGTKSNLQAARAAYEKSNLEWPEVMDTLGFILMNPKLPNSDPARGLRLMETAANNGFSDAQNSLAYCFKNGIGVKVDHAMAFRFMYCCWKDGTQQFKDLAYQFLSDEHDQMDVFFDVVAREVYSYKLDDVLKYLEIAAEHTNDPELWYQLAIRYPRTMPEADEKIAHAYTTAAAHGNIKAFVGYLYTSSDTSVPFEHPRNYPDVADVVKALATLPQDATDAPTVVTLARIYAGDTSTVADIPKAIEWAAKAEALGDYRVTLNIARAYYSGKNGWPANLAEALKWQNRIPKKVFDSFKVPTQQQASVEDQLLVDQLVKAFDIREKVDIFGNVTINSLAPFDNLTPEKKAAANKIFEEGFALENKNARAAVRKYADAAVAGNLNALIRIAIFAREDVSILPPILANTNWPMAVEKLLYREADTGDANAATSLADNYTSYHFAKYLYGVAVPMQGKANGPDRKYFRMAADQGNPAAAAWVGLDYLYDGDNKKIDPVLSEKYLRIAIANVPQWKFISARYSLHNTSYDNMFPLVIAQLNHFIQLRDRENAVTSALPNLLTLLEKLEAKIPPYSTARAAKADQQLATARSFEFMGETYSAPEQDLSKAVFTYADSASNGNGWAALNIGNYFSEGRPGAPKDPVLAKRWRVVGRKMLEIAAPFDGETAENLGLALIAGEDAKTGYKLEAVQWLDRDVPAGIRILQTAAITNNPHAAAMLSTLIGNDISAGAKIPQDAAISEAWSAVYDQLQDDDPKIRQAGIDKANQLIHQSAKRP